MNKITATVQSICLKLLFSHLPRHAAGRYRQISRFVVIFAVLGDSEGRPAGRITPPDPRGDHLRSRRSEGTATPSVGGVMMDEPRFLAPCCKEGRPVCPQAERASWI